MTKMNLIKKFFYYLKPGILITCFFCMFVIVGCKTGTDGRDGVDGINGKDGVSINWRGSYESEEEITNPKYLDAYYNIKTGCSYIFDGEKWTLLAKAGLDGKDLINEAISDPIKLILPNDSEEKVLLTADYAPVKVCISNNCQVTKVVWKKGTENTKVDPYTLLNDSAAENVILDFANTAVFYVSENGWYDVVAQDTLGRCEWKQIEVKTIDTTPLRDVKNLVASTKDRTATVAWKDVSTSEKYNSPLKSVKISYIYNDDENDSNNGSLLVDAGVETAEILIPRAKTSEDFLRIKIQTVDEVGNVSEGVKVITWCSNSVYATEANFAERLMSMTTSGEIAVVGECDITVITTAMRKLRDEKTGIMIDLDLSEVVGWTSIGETNNTSFSWCSNLSGIILPDSLTTLERYAFSYTPITSIVIPDSVNTILSGSFQGCDKLETVKLSQNLTYLGDTFSSDNLKEITIPKNVNRISGHLSPRMNVIFEDKTSIWFKTNSRDFKGGTEIGPMVGDHIKELQTSSEMYFYNEKYQAE